MDPLTLPVEEYEVLPRGDQQVVFKARAVRDWTDFKRLCPEPTVPMRIVRDKKVADVDNKDFKDANKIYNDRQFAYMCVKSLEPSEIEWDTVKMDVPGTWCQWIDDLEKASFTNVEISRIQNLILRANQLDEEHLKKARELFVQGLQTA